MNKKEIIFSVIIAFLVLVSLIPGGHGGLLVFTFPIIVLLTLFFIPLLIIKIIPMSYWLMFFILISLYFIIGIIFSVIELSNDYSIEYYLDRVFLWPMYLVF